MKILLLDIETAPNRAFIWGLFNQNVAINQIEEPGYTLCWAAKWHDSNKMMYSSLFGDGRRKMLERIHSLIDEADVIVHYNGTSFDIPTLNAEFLKEGMDPPAPALELDLLKVVRRRFRLTSNKLSYVLEFLELPAKVEHKGMSLWRGCMAGDKKSWRTMEQYNKQDVRSLESLYERLRPWISNHPNFGLFQSNSEPTCPNCGGTHLQRRGLYYTRVLVYQRYRCMDCGTWSRERATNLEPEERKNVLVGVL